MMTKLTETSLGGGSYVVPTVKVLEIASEGLLCGSAEFEIQSFSEDEETLNF